MRDPVIPGKPGDRLARALAAVRLALRNAGLRRTRPREFVLTFLAVEHGPFTNEEIFRATRGSGLDLTTVYRCLSTFEAAGLVRRCDFGDGIARYEYQADAGRHHHHVICVRCRRTENLESCRLPRFEARVRKLGYTEIRHSLEFFGVCRDCRRLPK